MEIVEPQPSLETTAFSQADVEPFEFRDPERHELAMREAMDVLMVVDPKAHQEFSALLMNRDYIAPNTVPILVPGQYIGSVINPERKYEAYQLAAAFPNRPILLLDLPGNGRSDRFTEPQRQEILSDRRISRVARALLNGAKTQFSNATEIDVLGTSLGGLASLEMVAQAGQLDLKPRNFVGHEVVGLDENRHPIGLMYGFLWVDYWDNKNRYQKDAAGERLRQGYQGFIDELEKYGYRDGQYLNDGGFYQKEGYRFPARMMLFHSPIATTAGLAALELTLNQHPDFRAGFMNAGRSAVNIWPHIEPEARRLLSQYGDRLVWQLWPEDGHSVGTAPQLPRLTAFSQFIIEHHEAIRQGQPSY